MQNGARAKKVGLPPGSLVHVGVGSATGHPPSIEVVNYDAQALQEKRVTRVEEVFDLRDSTAVSWINIYGVDRVEAIEQLGQHFGLHPLVLEDIVHTQQRPKVEVYDDCLFIVTRVFDYGEDGELVCEQVSLVLGRRYVLLFQERESDRFESVKTRLRSGRKRIRSSGPDYLAYAILDLIVDSYFALLDRLEARIEAAEDRLLSDPQSSSILHTIYELKQEIILLRKNIWPARDLVGTLLRSESDLIASDTVVYLRDVYDHAVRIYEALENFRETASALHDIYLSALSNQMNQVMKVLSIIATIFIPLTFIAGIYGMNFEYMPELRWRWGYPAVLAVMLGLAIFMLVLFKRKKWL